MHEGSEHAINELLVAYDVFGVEMSRLEIFAFLTSLLSVWLTTRQNIWSWPVGIFSVVAYGALFYHIKLYADATLQIFFLVTGFQGWYYWLHGGRNRTELSVSTLSRGQIVLLLPVLIVCVTVVGYFFQQYTDAHLPFWDAAASGSSVLAQVLMMRKKLESWILWLLIDVLYVGIYLYKGVTLTAILYGLFIVLAAQGFFAWKRSLATMPSRLDSATA